MPNVNKPSSPPVALARSTILVSCRDIEASGKRHNSFRFTFAVDRALEGRFESSRLVSRWLFAGFGGGQLLEKLEATGPWRSGGDELVRCRHRVVLRLYREHVPGRDAQLRILWAAREQNRSRLEALEEFGDALRAALNEQDLSVIRAHITPTSHLNEERFSEIVAELEQSGGWVDADQMVMRSLMLERNSSVWIGSGDYGFRAEYVGKRWVIVGTTSVASSVLPG